MVDADDSKSRSTRPSLPGETLPPKNNVRAGFSRNCSGDFSQTDTTHHVRDEQQFKIENDTLNKNVEKDGKDVISTQMDDVLGASGIQNTSSVQSLNMKSNEFPADSITLPDLSTLTTTEKDKKKTKKNVDERALSKAGKKSRTWTLDLRALDFLNIIRGEPDGPITWTDLQYVIYETTDNISAYKRRNFVNSLIELGEHLTREEIMENLVEFPESEDSLKLDLVNTNKLTEEEIILGLQQAFQAEAEKAGTDVKILIKAVTTAYDNLEAYAAQTNDEPIPQIEKYEILTMDIVNQTKALYDVTETLVALSAAQEPRIVGNKIYFPRVRASQTTATYLIPLLYPEDYLIPTSEKEITRKLIIRVTSQDFLPNQQADEVFQIALSETPANGTIVLQVFYRSGPIASEVFKNYFLDHLDKILKWREKPSQGKSKCAIVVVQLGLTKFPPRYPSRKIWLRNQQFCTPAYLTQASISEPQSNVLIEAAKKEGCNDSNTCDKLAWSRARQAEDIEGFKQTKQTQKAYDPKGMTCNIVYTFRSCNLCRTINHTFTGCKNLRKECKLCGSMDHLNLECYNRYDCQKAHHLEEKGLVSS